MSNAKIVVVNGEQSEILRSKSQEIKVSDLKSEKIKKLKQNMKKALVKEKYGVAIAAPQIAEPLQVFLISASTFAYAKEEKYNLEKHEDEFFFNPKIIKHSKNKIESDEGCLSVPLKYSHSVPRYEKVTVRYMDESGKTKTLNASGFLARVLQHEIDHLHGILYIDKAKKVIDVDEDLRPVNKNHE